MELADDYPIFRRFLILRATQRRSNFLQVFQEMRHTEELKIKCRGVNMDGIQPEFENDDMDSEERNRDDCSDDILEIRLRNSIR